MNSSVKLLGITTPKIDGINNVEEFIAYVARVSNPSNQNNSLTSAKLLKYLIANKHWSPFEMASMVLEINTTRDIARQILRHRSFSFQEFSQRYANPTELGFSIRETRLQDQKNRQNSIETDDTMLNTLWETYQTKVLEEVKSAYSWALEKGIAKEQARAILPEGLTNSRMYMSGSIRSWIHYCEIRTDKSTQKEHREIALQCKEILAQQLPSLSEYI